MASSGGMQYPHLYDSAQTEVSRSRSQADLFERVWADPPRVYEPDAARPWPLGFNPLLGDRRRIDCLRAWREQEVIRAIRAERTDSFA